jgi:uncharacterized membrane protein HdeD (DUF308 family)
MSTTGLPETPIERVIRHELHAIRGQWVWLVALGIALVVLGTLLLVFPVVATLATVTVLGILILLGGIMEIVAAFWCRQWSGFFLTLLSGVLGVVVGGMLLGNPITGGLALTVLLASFLFVGGIFKAAAALTHRFVGWGWLFTGGVIDILLGLFIWLELPIAGLTFIGLFIGISLVFRGATWVMLGLAVKQLLRVD